MEDNVTVDPVQDNEQDDFVIDENVEDAVELGAVTDGEYKLQCVKCTGKTGERDDGTTWKALSLLLDFPEVLDGDFFNYFLFLPGPGDDEKQKKRANSKLKIFKLAWGLDPAAPFRPADLEGREAWAYVTSREDDEYGLQNQVKRWITGPDGGSSEPDVAV